MSRSNDELKDAFDEDGFLTDPRIWTEAIAEKIAQSSGLDPLTDAHWKIIDYLRRHYLENGTLPLERVACHESGLEEECVQRLFNHDRRLAWRVAGLPNPGEEAKTYM